MDENERRRWSAMTQAERIADLTPSEKEEMEYHRKSLLKHLKRFGLKDRNKLNCGGAR